MVLNKDRQLFTKAVAVLIALQGLAWVGLTITAIVVYSSPPDKLTNDIHSYERYTQYISRIIYDEFMEDGRSRVIRPKDFMAFIWIYLILSAIWVAASIDQYAAVQLKKERQSVIFLALGAIVLTTCIIDLVFVSLLGRDLDTCPFDLTVTSATTNIITTSTTQESTSTTTEASTSSDTTTNTPTTTGGDDTVTSALLMQALLSLRNSGSTSGGTAIDCQLANGIVMTIAARGFVLWITNVVLSISLIVIGAKILRTPSLLTYGNNTIPRVKAPESRKQPSPTGVFLGDYDIFTPPLSQQSNNRNRNSTPLTMGNKNQALYY